MFIPFYIPGKDRLRIVIAGGGYSGLAALVTFREHRPDAEIVLIDPRSTHLKITHLHESFRRPVADFRVPFSVLEKRFAIRHVQAGLAFDEALLRQWNSDRALTVDGEICEFDYLVMATGAGFRKLEKGDRILDLDDFAAESGPELLDDYCSAAKSEPWISVVGAGATGIQFLFEIAHFVRSQRISCRLRLVDSDARTLKQFHPDLGRYVEARMGDLDIEYVPNTFFRGQETDQITLEDRETGEQTARPSCLSLLFIGRSPESRLNANWFGQVVVDGETLDRVFTAGDCSSFRGFSTNAMTAQAAVRKGKLVARNILRQSGMPKILEPYLHRDLGYVVSLGPLDAVGWIALERNVVGGLPAAVVKEIVEAQYDLLLAGIDTYLV